MPELDLVPPRYHDRRQAQRWIIRILVGYGMVFLLLIGARVYLERGIAVSDQEISALQQEQARMQAEARERASLEQEVGQLEQHLAVLDGLRGGISSKKMFEVVDNALDERVWFRRWDFRRAGEIVETEKRGVETGYFIVLPKENPEDPPRAWRLQTHMEILAEAEDHSALGSFVRRLSQRPEIESARILNTKTRSAGDSARVEFELAIVVRSQL